MDVRCNELINTVQEQENNIIEMELYFRRDSVRKTNNWPESENEDTDKLVVQLCEDVGSEIKPGDISGSHMVGKPVSDGKPRPVLVIFTSYRVRQKLFVKRSKLKRCKGWQPQCRPKHKRRFVQGPC